MSQPLTAPEMAALLRSYTVRQGSRWWAREHGVSASMVSSIQCGKIPCPDSIARALGYERQVRYVRVAA